MNTQTNTCLTCSGPIEQKPNGRPKSYCSRACQQKAYRLRRAKPVSLERLTRSQSRSDRYRDHHVQRPRELGGKTILTSGNAGLLDSGTDALATSRPGEYGRRKESAGTLHPLLGNESDPTQREALQLAAESPTARFARLREQAAIEFVWYVLGGFVYANEHSEGIPTCPHEHHANDNGHLIRLVRWVVKWRNVPELTAWERQEIIRHVMTEFELVKADLRREKERKKKMELATIAAQNEEILAKLEGLRVTQAEILERVGETVERVRERFPDDTEVSAAVDRLLESI